MVVQPPTHPLSDFVPRYPKQDSSNCARAQEIFPNPDLIDQISQGNGNSAGNPAIRLTPLSKQERYIRTHKDYLTHRR